jgi:hypothetical protein
MEWVKPIGMVERDLRYIGIFLLVDFSGKRLWFFGHKKNSVDINRAMESVKGRCDEMVKYLTARATRAEGETK